MFIEETNVSSNYSTLLTHSCCFLYDNILLASGDNGILIIIDNKHILASHIQTSNGMVHLSVTQ